MSLIGIVAVTALLVLFVLVLPTFYERDEEPTFVTERGARVYAGEFYVSKEQFEKIEETLLELFPIYRPEWTQDAIRDCLRGLRVYFVPMPIWTLRGPAAGTADPDRGAFCHVGFTKELTDSAFVHEFVHVLSIKAVGVSYDDDVAHRNWIECRYYDAIEAVNEKARRGTNA